VRRSGVAPFLAFLMNCKSFPSADVWPLQTSVKVSAVLTLVGATRSQRSPCARRIAGSYGTGEALGDRQIVVGLGGGSPNSRSDWSCTLSRPSRRN
jgi:hypothetical protein